MKKWAGIGARTLLGLVFFVFGLNGFLNFIPLPEESTQPEGAQQFIGALTDSGYMLPMVAGVETLGGGMLLFNVFAPFGLVLLAPVIVNIFTFHAFLERSGMPIAVIVVVLAAFLTYCYWPYYKGVLERRAKFDK